VKQEEVVVKIVARKKISILFCPKKKEERKTGKRRTKKSESGIGNGNKLGGCSMSQLVG
jgi:hypothetical protein